MAYKRSRADNGRVFECKTCYKQFPSFQALGGHRTSHKRMKMREGSEAMKTERIKKVHGCTVCGLEFSMGQALGGHMTKHRRHEYGDQKDEKKEAKLLFDLNLPPMHTLDQFFCDVPYMFQFF
ncbi:Zinc finger protein ZAT12 [Dendrobium catenatum]|uniref:Zinc finger protein ZAT12 n=1 Tax=Dendrobium catenatum TaxID=906689 RepID=A0A2I0X979_9ASPA|nr:Zinc finger protein ZAT12 [Dendrobium catenatum]